MQRIYPLLLASLMAAAAAAPAMANEIGLSGRSGGRGVADKSKTKKTVPPAQAALPATPFVPNATTTPGATVNSPILPAGNVPATNPNMMNTPRSSQTVSGANGMRIVGSDTVPPGMTASGLSASPGTAATKPPAMPARPSDAPVGAAKSTLPPGAVPPGMRAEGLGLKATKPQNNSNAKQIGFDPKARRDASGNLIEDKPVASTPAAAPALRSDRTLGGDMSKLRKKQADRAARNAPPPADEPVSDDAALAKKLIEALDKNNTNGPTIINTGRNRNF